MLTLAKTEAPAIICDRIAHMQQTTISLRTLTPAQLRAVYPELQNIRDILSLLLDKADGKT